MKSGLHYGCFRALLVVLWMSLCGTNAAASIAVTDDAGNRISLDSAPRHVVSLAPSATEILFAIGAGDVLAGITHHSSGICGAGDKTIVGGFFSPSVDRIMSLKPDLVIVSAIHSDIIGKLKRSSPVLVMNTRKMDDAFRHIRLLGALFQREKRAAELVKKNTRQLDLIARKVAKIPEDKRKRVMRLMGRDRVMTPGNDSFQNEMIRAAGCIPPDFGKAGSVVPVTRDEFVSFNPHVIYGCGGDIRTSDTFFSQDGWNTVDAVLQHRIYSFPCDLTCRAGAHLGDFVSWLSANVYAEEFNEPHHEQLLRKVVGSRPLSILLDYIRGAAVFSSIMHDFENKSLIIDFKSPRTVVSTLEGQRDGILTVGNHYSPPPCWALNHSSGLKQLQSTLYPMIGRDIAGASFLFTGADMDNLAIKKEPFKAMTVYALVTAGVRGNAVRMSKDVGIYYEPGTINIIWCPSWRIC